MLMQPRFFARAPHPAPRADKDGDLGLRELLDIQKLEDDIQSLLTPSLLFRCGVASFAPWARLIGRGAALTAIKMVLSPCPGTAAVDRKQGR